MKLIQMNYIKNQLIEATLMRSGNLTDFFTHFKFKFN